MIRRAGAGDEHLERVEVDGLRQVWIEAGRERTTPVLFATEAGERHEARAAERGVLANPTRHLVAVDAGEPDVDEHHVGRIRARAYEMGLEARPFLYPAAFRSLAGSTPERVQHLVETSREVPA